MTGRKTFHNTVVKILREQPDSNVADTIRKIKRLYPNSNDYFNIFDSLTFRLGVNLYPQPWLHEKKDKIIGYQPRIKYLEDNLLNECPRVRELRSGVSLLSIPNCNRILAETFIEDLSWNPNLDQILSKLD